MYLATTVYSVPGKTLAEKFSLAGKVGLQGIRVSNMDLDFTELQRVAAAERVMVTSIEVHKDWRPFNGSNLIEEREEAERVFLNAVESGVSHGFAKFSTSIETGFFDEEINAQMTGLRMSVSNILKDDRDFVVLIRPKIDDLFYTYAESAEHATELMVHYVDWFHSSKIALDFDVGIHSMYGDPARAIRFLGSRIRTITITSYNIASGRLCNVRDSDLDWKSIGDALNEIRFDGAVVLSFRGIGEQNFLEQIAHFQKNVYSAFLK